MADPPRKPRRDDDEREPKRGGASRSGSGRPPARGSGRPDMPRQPETSVVAASRGSSASGGPAPRSSGGARQGTGRGRPDSRSGGALADSSSSRSSSGRPPARSFVDRSQGLPQAVPPEAVRAGVPARARSGGRGRPEARGGRTVGRPRPESLEDAGAPRSSVPRTGGRGRPDSRSGTGRGRPPEGNKRTLAQHRRPQPDTQRDPVSEPPLPAEGRARRRARRARPGPRCARYGAVPIAGRLSSTSRSARARRRQASVAGCDPRKRPRSCASSRAGARTAPSRSSRVRPKR